LTPITTKEVLAMPSLNTDYRIASGPVRLSIIIGDAQIGVSLVKIEKNQVAKEEKIKDLPLGKGSELRGKTLSIKTRIADVNTKTNHTSVTYQLIDGTQTTEFYLEGTVEAEGDAISYRATINFV
jgi:hypothetical protein